MKISNKILIANIAIVLIATISTSAISLYVTKKEINRQVTVSLNGRLKAFRELLAPKGHPIRLADGKLQADGTVLDGNNEIAEKLKELFGGEATIFNHDIRVATTIKKDDGSRAVGTALQGPAREAVIEKGEVYLGEAVVLGTPHFAAYMPIKDEAGAVIGALFVGEKKSEYLAVFDQLKYLTICLATALAGLLSLAGYLVLQKALVPLRNLVGTLQDVAEGDGNLTHRLEAGSDEIGVASRYFNTFIERVHSIVLNVADNTASVASASAQLHSSTGKLAETTDDVAAQATNVSTAGEQMAATSAEISKSCIHAVDSAQRACDMATVGATDVEQTIRSRRSIKASASPRKA
jgi:methyl-accepting chemotaxis protein